MENRKIIPSKYLPFKLPIWSTVFQVFLMYHFNLQGWICGVWATIIVIIWVLLIIAKSKQIEDASLINRNDGENS